MRVIAAREAHEVGIDPFVDHLRELAHVGANRKIGVINPAELVRVGVDVDKRLARMLGGDEGITIGRRLAEAWTDRQDQVSVADTLLELGTGPVAELAGIDLAVLQIASWRRNAAATGIP